MLGYLMKVTVEWVKMNEKEVTISLLKTLTCSLIKKQ
jgi:hypothetical protein